MVDSARIITYLDRGRDNDKSDRELRSLRQQHSQQVQCLKQIIQSQISHLAEKDRTITHKDETINELRPKYSNL